MRREQEIALALAKKHHTNNPFEIAEELGFIIEKKPLGQLKAYYRITKRNKFITLNSNLKRYEEIIECGHELGHYVMHRDHNTFMLSSLNLSINRYESEANRFSAYLKLLSYSRRTLANYSLQQISMMTGISMEILDLINL